MITLQKEEVDVVAITKSSNGVIKIGTISLRKLISISL